MEAQEEYYETGISLIATHSEIPEFPDCPGIEQPFLEDQFEADDSVFFSIFLRDALMGEVGTIEGPGSKRGFPCHIPTA